MGRRLIDGVVCDDLDAVLEDGESLLWMGRSDRRFHWLSDLVSCGIGISFGLLSIWLIWSDSFILGGCFALLGVFGLFLPLISSWLRYVSTFVVTDRRVMSFRAGELQAQRLDALGDVWIYRGPWIRDLRFAQAWSKDPDVWRVVRFENLQDVCGVERVIREAVQRKRRMQGA
jgi:hypothetical protein